MDNLQHKLQRLAQRHRLERRARGWLAVSSLVTVLGIVLALLMPAFTLEQTTYCGLKEHTHTLACASAEHPCELEEHVHSDACYSNPHADVEDAQRWEQTLPGFEEGASRLSKLVAIARSQLGYCASEDNYAVNEDGTHAGYTRYGAWAGDPYAPWDAPFVRFCLSYAGIDAELVPQAQDAKAWMAHLADQGLLRDVREADVEQGPRLGDLAFVQDDDDAATIGVVAGVDQTDGTIHVVMGNADGEVRELAYAPYDERLAGYYAMPKELRNEASTSAGRQEGQAEDRAQESEKPEADKPEPEADKPEASDKPEADKPEPESAEPEADPADSQQAHVLEATSAGYRITVDLGQASAEGYTLAAQPLEPSDAQLGSIEASLSESLDNGMFMEATVDESDVRLFDIVIRDADGNEVEPSDAVQVRVASAQADAHLMQEDVAPMVVHLADDGAQKLEAESTDEGFAFTTDGFSAYAFVFTVDFNYNGTPFSMRGYDSIALSKLFRLLDLRVKTDDVDAVSFSNEELVAVGRTQDDWTLTSLKPFATDEELTVVLKTGTTIHVAVTDSVYTDDLSNMFAGLALYKNGKEMDIAKPVVIREGDVFRIKLQFEENADYQFLNTEDPMYYGMPEQFEAEDFSVDIDVVINVGGRPHTLTGNHVTYVQDTHQLKLEWNTTAPEFAYLVQSGNALVDIDVSGTFDASDNKEVRFSDDFVLHFADPADVGVTKTAQFDKDAQPSPTMTYTVVLRADGDITLPVTLHDSLDGTALSYLADAADSFAVTWGNGTTPPSAQEQAILDEFVAGFAPQAGGAPGTAFAQDGRSFDAVLNVSKQTPLKSGQQVTLTYKTSVDMEKVSLSTTAEAMAADEGIREQVYADLGNTVTIQNPNNEYDEPDNNVAECAVPINFSDIRKEGVLGPETNGVDDDGNDISFRDITWTVDVNTEAVASLAGSTITDTLRYIAKVNNDPCLTDMSLYPSTGAEAGITVEVYDQEDGAAGEPTKLVETRLVPWTALKVRRATQEETDDAGATTTYNTITWAYNIPGKDKGEGSYYYKITYTTRANLQDIKAPSEVQNEVQGKPGADTASVDLHRGSGPGIKVNKQAESTTLERVVWKLDVTADVAGYDKYYRITDSLPYQWIENDDGSGNTQYRDGIAGSLDAEEFDALTPEQADARLKEAITVEGLQEGEDWHASLIRGARGTADKVVIRFYKQVDGDWVEGLLPFASTQGDYYEQVTYHPGEQDEQRVGRRHIYVRLTTDNNQEWINKSTDRLSTKPWLSNHTNNVQARGDVGHFDTGSATTAIVKPKIIKTLSLNNEANADGVINDYFTIDRTFNAGEANEKTMTFPVYRFYVNVGGVRADNGTVLMDTDGTPYIEVRDTVTNPQIWTLFKKSDFTAGNLNWLDAKGFYGDQAGYPNTANGAARQLPDSSRFEAQVNPDGSLVFRIFDPPTKDDGTYYNFYTVLYGLVPNGEDGFDALVQEMLKEENRTYQRLVTKSVLNSTNTAKLVIDQVSEADWPQDDAPFTYEYNPTAKSIVAYDSQTKTITYKVVLNAERAKLIRDDSDVDYLEMKDTFSSSLSVDYSTIGIQTDPADRVDQVSYDYSGRTGTFRIPDETKVVITYDARVVGEGGTDALLSNTVSLCGFTTTTERTQHISSVTGSMAGVYQLRLYKYAEGHMEEGLPLARFRLLDSEKRPVLDPDGNEITFTSQADGYTIITLDESVLHVAINKNTTYYLQEIDPPITYQDGIAHYYKQDPVYYSFLISDNPDYSAPGGVYVYSNGDILKVRNFEDLGGINVSKAFAGNVELSDAQKQKIRFRIEKRDQSGRWVTFREMGYKDFRYSDWTNADDSTITGTYHLSLEDAEVKAGTYRITELGAYDEDDPAMEDVDLTTEYLIDGSASDTRVFAITDDDLGHRKDGAYVSHPKSHNVVITNSYFKNVYTFTKQDADSGAALPGAQFNVYRVGEDSDTLVWTYTTGSKGAFVIDEQDKDDAEAWLYTKGELYYAQEAQAPEGYVLPEKCERYYFHFGGAEVPAGVAAVDLSSDYGNARVPNSKGVVSVKVEKKWGPNGDMDWLPLVKYVRVGLYQQEEGSVAGPTPVLDDGKPITVVLTPDHQVDTTTFVNLPAASNAGKVLNYSVQEVGVSFDGQTEHDPKDTFAIDYKKTGAGVAAGADPTVNTRDAAQDVGLVVNNTDKGTEFALSKEWYEKRTDGTTKRIQNPVGSDYASTFELYRTVGDQVGTRANAVEATLGGQGGSGLTITKDSDLVFAPGDTVDVHVQRTSEARVSFAFQYTTTDSNVWVSFKDDTGASVSSGWMEKNYYEYDATFTIPSDKTYARLLVCNWDASGTADVTLRRVKRGSTVAGSYTSANNDAAIGQGCEHVADITLPTDDGSWEYYSDTLPKYDESGNEYTYWVKEKNAASDTTYSYLTGDVTVRNYKDTTAFAVFKDWGAGGQGGNVWFDLYRTTQTIQSGQQATTNGKWVDFVYHNMVNIKSGSVLPSRAYIQVGDKLRLTFSDINMYAATNTKLINTTIYNAPDRLQSLGLGAYVANNMQETYTIERTITQQVYDRIADMLYVAVWNNPAVIKIEHVPNAVSIAHDQLDGYAGSELVQTNILLGKDGWNSGDADLVLPTYDPNGNPYHYYALEHVVPGYTANYSILQAEATITNTKDPSPATGSLRVGKTVTNGYPEQSASKTYRFTVSKDGYYFDANGNYGTEATGGFVHGVKAGDTVTIDGLPVGEYTVEELEKPAQIPYYTMSSQVIVNDAPSEGGVATVTADATTQADIRNTYVAGVPKTSLSATKKWVNLFGLEAAPPAGSSATMVLRRYFQDGTEDQVNWGPQEEDYQVVLDGMADLGATDLTGGKVEYGRGWKYVWANVDKVYWDYDDEEYKDYVYRLEERSVTYEGVTTDLSQGGDAGWNVSTWATDDGWVYANQPNQQVVTLTKTWQSAAHDGMAWPTDGEDHVPITVTLNRALNVAGEGLREDSATVDFVLVPNNERLAELNEATGCVVTVAEDGGSYVFSFAGLENWGTKVINNKELEGTWVYSFDEDELDGFARATDEPVANGDGLVNIQQATSQVIKVDKAVALADGHTTYKGAWPAEGFTFTLDSATSQDGAQVPVDNEATATKGRPTATFDGSKVVTFTKPGTYAFAIAEEDGRTADEPNVNITYDTTPRRAVVVVGEEAGKLVVSSVTYHEDEDDEEGSDALTVTNTLSKPGSVTFKLKKTYVGASFTDRQPFAFRLTQVQANNSTEQATRDVKLAEPATTTTQGQEGSVAELAFNTDITFTRADEGKEFWFLIEELPGTADNVRYDPGKVWVKVSVSLSGNDVVVSKNDAAYDPASADFDAEFTNERQVDVTATKLWLLNDGRTQMPASDLAGMKATFRLTRWKYAAQSSAFVEDSTFGARVAELDGAVDEHETEPWHYTWAGLPKSYLDADGYLNYEYRVEETQVTYADGTVQPIQNDMTADGRFAVLTDGMTVRNRLNTKNVEFGKQWKDASGNAIAWPQDKTIAITLRREGDDQFGKTYKISPHVATEGVSWTTPSQDDARKIYWFTLRDLVRFKSDGVSAYRYYIEESPVAYDAASSYITNYSAGGSAAFERKGGSDAKQYIINSSPVTDLKVTKEWYDLEGKRTAWPQDATIELRLYRRHANKASETPASLWRLHGVRNGEVLTTSLDDDCPVAATCVDSVITLTGLPAGDEDGLWLYFLREDGNVDGYAQGIYANRGAYITLGDAAYQNGVIRNVRAEETPVEPVDFSFSKVWKNRAGRSVAWPAGQTITVTLNAGTDSDPTAKLLSDATYTLGPSSHEGWEVSTSDDGTVTTFTIRDLPAQTASGTKLAYYVVEAQPEGYGAPSYATSAGNIFIDGTARASDGQQIINRPLDAVELPYTGGIGPTPLIAMGFIVLLVACLGLRRRSDTFGPRERGGPD